MGILCALKINVDTFQVWCGRPSSCSDILVWTKVCFDESGDWKVWQVPITLVKNALAMVSLEKLQDVSICWRSQKDSCLYKWQRGWLLGLLSLMCNNHQWTSSSIDKENEAVDNSCKFQQVR